MTRAVQKIVREEAPRARFAVNLWAVAEWSGYPSPFTLDFWQEQVLLSKAVAEEKDLLGPHCGVVFSMDNSSKTTATGTTVCRGSTGCRISSAAT
jgi:hypothetical protein